MKSHANGRAGFTLAEMMVVITIIVIIAGITIPLFVSTRATTRRNDAVNTVKSALAGARQAAIQRRTVVALEFVSSNDTQRGDILVMVDKSKDITDDRRRLGQPIPMPEFIKFDTTSPEWTLDNGWIGDKNDVKDTITFIPSCPPPYPDIAYMPDGTLADAEGYTDIALVDRSETARTVIRVLPATGLVVDARHLQDPATAEGPSNPKVKGWL